MPRARSQRVSQVQVVTPKSTRKAASARKNHHVEEEEENESGSDVELPSALTASDYRKPRSSARAKRAATNNRPPPPASARSRRGRKVSESSDDEEEPPVSEEESSSDEESEEEDAEADASFEDPDDGDFNAEEGDAGQKRTFIPKDRDPVYIQNREVPPLVLPPSSEDLILPNNLLLQALGVYEILRRFFQSLQLTPFRFEDFCCAVTAEENSRLIAEIFSAVIRLLVRDTESSGFWLAPHDEKDSIYLPVACLDEVTWPEMLRMYLQSSPEYKDGLKIVEQSSFPCVSAKDKLDLMEIVSSALLRLPGVIRSALTADFVISHEEHCRNCQRPGDLICCELCPATYHLECSVPPLKEIPEGEWVCHICRLNQIPGVSDCVSEVEKQNLHMRIEPVGLDRHGRRFTFLARRLFVYEEDESRVWYYSTLPQFEQVLDLMDPEDLEKELCEAIDELRDEVENHFDVTQKLTKKYSSGRAIYLDQANATIAEERKRRDAEKAKKDEEDKKGKDSKEDIVVKEEMGTSSSSSTEPVSKDSSPAKQEGVEPGPKIATRTRTGALAAKSYSDSLLKNAKDVTTILVPPHIDGSNTFDLLKAAGPSYKLGVEGLFRLYKNMFKDNPFAQDKAQRQDERDRKRHLGTKYSLNAEKNTPGEFKWTGLKLGITKTLITTIKTTLMIELEKSIHPSFFHPTWKESRKMWQREVEEADTPEKLALALIRFESSCRPCIFMPSWHENMGCVKWCKIAAPDREELRNQERRRKREDDEAVVRSAKRCYVSFVQGVQHQIWKHKGEEFRLSGKGGVYWWSSRFGDEKESQPERVATPVEPQKPPVIEDDVIDISSALSSNSSLFSIQSNMKEKLDRIWAKENLFVKDIPVTETDTNDTVKGESENVPKAEDQPAEKPEVKMEVDGGKLSTEGTPEVNKLDEKKEPSEKLDLPLGVVGLKLNGLLEKVPKNGEKDQDEKEEAAKKEVIPRVDNGPKVGLPPLLDFKREGDLLDFYRLSQHDYFGLALNGGLVEMGGFKYDFKASPNWEYAHFPRPNMRTAWRFRTYSVRNWGGVALQIRTIHAALRWEEMNTKPPQAGRKITHDEHSTIYAELVRKRPSARNLEFPRYEYMVKRVVMPNKDNNYRSNQKSTPAREGLRERRVDTPKSKDPYLLDSWVIEDELELWEIRSFYERVEHPPPELPKVPPSASIMVPAPSTSTAYPGVVRSNSGKPLVKGPADGIKGLQSEMGLKLVPIKAYTTDGKQQYILVPTNSDGASIAKHATAIAKFAQRTPGSQLLVNGPVTTPVEEQVLTVRSIEEPDSAIMPPPPDDDSGWIREHNEKLNKRMQQVRKAITTRIGVLKHGHARIKSEIVAAVLQSMVDENPELIPGLPEAPSEPVIPLSLFPQPQLVKHCSPERKSPKKSPVKKETAGLPSVTGDGTLVQPEVIPTFKIKKSLLTPPPNVPEVSALKKSPEEFKSRAKMINTAPPPPEPKPSGPPKKRGRKSNAEKLAEEVAMMEAEKAEQEAQKAATVTGGFLPLKDGVFGSETSKKKKKNTMMINGEVVSGKKIKLENGGEKFVPEIHDFVSPVKTEGMSSIVRTATPSSDKKSSSDGKKRARMQSTSSERSPTAQRRKKVKEEEDETVLHCYCRKVYDPTRFMIECDKCERWFHGSCVHVVEGSIPKKAKWFCPDCLAGSAAAGSAVLAAPRPASGLKHHTQPDAGKALPKKKKKKYRHREEKAASKDGRGEPSKMDQRAPLPKLKIKIPPPPLAPTKTPSTEEGAPVGGENLEKDVIPNHVLEAEESSEEGTPPDVLTSGAARNVEGVKPAEGVESPSTSTKEERSPNETDIPSISVEELERGEAEKAEKQQPRITLTLQKNKKKSAEATKKNGEVISETMQEPVSSKSRKASKKGEAGKKESQGQLVKKEEEGSTKVKKPVMVIVPPPTAAAFKSKGGKVKKEEAPVEKKKVVRKDPEAEELTKTKGSKKGAKKGMEKEAPKEVFCLCREPSKEHLVQKFIACDKCKEWFHPRCVGLTDVKAEKMAKFMCPTCSNQPQFRDFLYRKIVPPLDPAVLLSVIEDHLERSRVVDMFRKPVDLNEVPSYSAVIQEPMDLSTMKEKIQDGAYETVLDFVKDAGLIFDNAKTFNPSVRSPFYKGADTLEEVFVNRMNKLRANWN